MSKKGMLAGDAGASKITLWHALSLRKGVAVLGRQKTPPKDRHRLQGCQRVILLASAETGLDNCVANFLFILWGGEPWMEVGKRVEMVGG